MLRYTLTLGQHRRAIIIMNISNEIIYLYGVVTLRIQRPSKLPRMLTG